MFLVESEKTAVIMEAATASGALPLAGVWLATGGANGARWAERETFAVLRDRRITLVPDNDEAGRTWHTKADELRLFRIAESVTVFDIRKLWSECPEGADIADLVVARYLTPEPPTPCPPAPPAAPPPSHPDGAPAHSPAALPPDPAPVVDVALDHSHASTYGPELNPTHEYVAVLLAWRAVRGACNASEAGLRSEYPEHADEALYAIRSGHITRDHIRRAAPAIMHAPAFATN